MSTLGKPRRDGRRLRREGVRISEVISIRIMYGIASPRILLEKRAGEFAGRIALRAASKRGVGATASPTSVATRGVSGSVTTAGPMDRGMGFAVRTGRLKRALPAMRKAALGLVSGVDSALVLSAAAVLSDNFRVLFRGSPGHVTIHGIGRTASTSYGTVTSLLISSLLSHSSRDFILTTFQPRSFFSSNKSYCSIRIMIVSQLSILL